MFISVIFNVEYMDMSSRKMWYLKNLLHCKENGWILITHDYIRTHFQELQDSITDRFLNQFEMRRFTIEEVNDVEQYFIPDNIFDDFEDTCGSRTEMLLRLSNENYSLLDNALENILLQIKEKHPNEQIEGVFHCLEGFKSVKTFADKCGCPLINYSFSAFRKPHGYRQTLYTTSVNDVYWTSRECKARYERFLSEDRTHLPIFSNEELIAIIGKEHTLPLIKLIDYKPKYEMLVCCECFAMVPQAYKNNIYTDDDILFECHKTFGRDNIKVRSHAVHLEDIQVDRTEMHNDPAATILSCKRVSAVLSQIMLKAGLWKRTAVMKKESTALSFMCEKDISSENTINTTALNFYYLCFLVPQELMFSDTYWKWRMTNPSETDIYVKHLTHIFDKLGISLEIKDMDCNVARFRELLLARGCDEHLIDVLTNKEIQYNIDWDTTTSRIEIVDHGVRSKYWRLNNKNEDDSYTTVLEIKNKSFKSMDFYPLDDIAGFASLKEVSLNGEIVPIEKGYFKYMPKVTGHFHIELPNPICGNVVIKCIWNKMTTKEYQQTLI